MHHEKRRQTNEILAKPVERAASLVVGPRARKPPAGGCDQLIKGTDGAGSARPSQSLAFIFRKALRIGEGLPDQAAHQPALVEKVAGVSKTICTALQIQRTADADQAIQKGELEAVAGEKGIQQHRATKGKAHRSQG